MKQLSNTEQELLRKFLEHKCVITHNDGDRIRSKYLYKHYRNYIMSIDQNPVGPTYFNEGLRNEKIRVRTMAGTPNYAFGIKLKQAHEPNSVPNTPSFDNDLNYDDLAEPDKEEKKKDIKAAALALYEPYMLLMDGVRRKLETNPLVPLEHIYTIDKKALVITLSDTHFGEKTVKKDYETGTEITLYSFAIGEKMIEEIFTEAYEGIKDRVEMYDEIVILCVGDMVDGDGTVFPIQMSLLEGHVFTQIQTFVSAIVRGIDFLRERLPHCKFRMRANVGNHGVTKGVMSRHWATNWDNALYRTLYNYILGRQAEGGWSNVDFKWAEEDNTMRINIKGHIVLLRHIMKKNLSTPASFREVTSLKDNFDADTELIITGHYHEEALSRVGRVTVLRSGCMPGPNHYSWDELAIISNPPTQWMFSVSSEYIFEDMRLYSFPKTRKECQQKIEQKARLSLT